jgi:hypothetical protein
MTARDAESDLSPFRAIAAFSAPSGQFHAHRCKAAKLVAQTKKCSLRVDAVEKGKNELTENFPCEPVETSIFGSAAAHKELTNGNRFGENPSIPWWRLRTSIRNTSMTVC